MNTGKLSRKTRRHNLQLHRKITFLKINKDMVQLYGITNSDSSDCIDVINIDQNKISKV